MAEKQMMGLGQLASETEYVFKRKYRWTLSLTSPCGAGGAGAIPEHFVKLAARPNFTLEETEINFLHGKMYLPGKGTWETITVTYYDIGNAGAGMGNLYSWLATVYNFQNPASLSQASKIGSRFNSGGYAGTADLKLYDGCGTIMEQWTLKQVWPQAVNFGELDYSSSEEVTIELTLRYAEVELKMHCGPGFKACCGGCDSQPGGLRQGVDGGINPQINNIA